MRFIAAVTLILLLSSNDGFARDSKAQKDERAHSFWSLVVALGRLQDRLQASSVEDPEIMTWYGRVETHYHAIHARFSKNLEVSSSWLSLEKAMSEQNFSEGRQKHLRLFRSALFRALDDIPTPTETPSNSQAEKRYLSSCAPCHGTIGDGQGTLSGKLRVKPRSFLSPNFGDFEAPVDHYATLMVGIESSEMGSFREQFSEDELWSLAFYVTSLKYRERQTLERCEKPIDFKTLAFTTDRDLLDGVLKDSVCGDKVAWFRSRAPFDTKTLRSEERFNLATDIQKNRRILWFGIAVLSVCAFFSWLLLRSRSRVK